jgi:hypothetical protein
MKTRRVAMNEAESLNEFAARMKVFMENQNHFPVEEFAKYIGKWIAWHPDGASIVASGEDPDAVYQLIEAAGLDPSQCVLDYIDGESST